MWEETPRGLSTPPIDLPEGSAPIENWIKANFSDSSDELPRPFDLALKKSIPAFVKAFWIARTVLPRGSTKPFFESRYFVEGHADHHRGSPEYAQCRMNIDDERAASVRAAISAPQSVPPVEAKTECTTNGYI